jgi:hypothetical protein
MHNKALFKDKVKNEEETLYSDKRASPYAHVQKALIIFQSMTGNQVVIIEKSYQNQTTDKVV